MLKKLIKMKTKKAFTLVELIVVIAIIGVLTAVLVPTMSGYITQAKVAGMDILAKSIKDVFTLKSQEMDAKGCGLTDISWGTIVGGKLASEDGSGRMFIHPSFTYSTLAHDINYRGQKAGTFLKFVKILEDELAVTLKEQKKKLFFIAFFDRGRLVDVRVSEETSYEVAADGTVDLDYLLDLRFEKVGIASEAGGGMIAPASTHRGLITGSAPKWSGTSPEPLVRPHC